MLRTPLPCLPPSSIPPLSLEAPSPPENLNLELEEGRSLPVEIRRRTGERSAHTGRELVELHGWATTMDPEEHLWISSLLKSAVDRVVVARDDAGEFAGRWCLSWNSYGESGGEHTYTLLLSEAEELSLDALVLEGMELHPYEYREEVVGEGIVVLAKMAGSETEVERIRSLLRGRQKVTVVRRGIQDDPREMRLALAEWSQSEDRVKYRIVLIDRGLEGAARPELAWIEEERKHAALGFYANFVERLVDLLVEKGALTREELLGLRESVRAAPGVARHEMWRVADVDDL
jgi:hypothetical protein